jgi:hypothetical protein
MDATYSYLTCPDFAHFAPIPISDRDGNADVTVDFDDMDAFVALLSG